MEKALIDWDSDDPVVLGGELANLPEESARAVINHFDITSSDVLGLALPTHHVGGFGVVARAHFSGAELLSYSGKWSAEAFVSWVEKVTITSLVPTQVADLVSGNFTAPPKLRAAIVGGGAFSPELQDKARALGWPVLESYGMTETSSQVATGKNLPLLSGWQAKVVDGRLALKGNGLLTGYFAEGKFTDPKKDGWFLTQDRAKIEENYLTILGRADRQVKVLGELVDLEAVETRWAEILDGEVALLALPDPRRGISLVLAYTGGGELIESMNATFPGPERLSSWYLVPALPRSALGKIDRMVLKQILHL